MNEKNQVAEEIHTVPFHLYVVQNHEELNAVLFRDTCICSVTESKIQRLVVLLWLRGDVIKKVFAGGFQDTT